MIRIALLVGALTLLQNAPSKAGALDWIGSNSCGKEKSHDYYFGQRTPYQRLMYMDHPKYESKMMRVRSEEVTYPMRGQTPGGMISFIEVLNMKSNDTAGCAYIKNGGVGSNFVTLKLKSQRGHGINFLVKVYGY